MPAPHILIVGAGIGGLAAAAFLAQSGARVDIFEKSDHLGDVGAGLQLSANAMHVLSALGCAGEIKARGFCPQNAVTRHYKIGRAELTMPLEDAHTARYGQPYIHIHRADLQDSLRSAAAAAGVIFHLGAEVENVTQDGQSAIITTGQENVRGDALIGADGIHSNVRKVLFGDHPASFTGQVAWRGTVKTSDVPDGLIPQDANAWLGPGRHFVAYYVRGGALINFVAVEERETWTEESWNLGGNIEDVKAAFKGWDPRIERVLSACDKCYLWGLFDRPPMPEWSQDHMTLLGDACHPMLPFMAQGAAMALEDAYVLSRCLARDDLSIPEALKAYANIRQPRTSMLQAVSRANANMFHLRSPMARAVRQAKFGLATRVPAVAHARFDKIYGVNVTSKAARL